MATASAARLEITGRNSSSAALGVVATGAGAGGGLDGPRSGEAATDAARPDGARPPRSSERAPRVPAIPPPAPVATTPSAEDKELRPVISRREALAVAIKELGDAPVIHANGYICRESFAIDDRPQNFYMIGSMGPASRIRPGPGPARPG